MILFVVYLSFSKWVFVWIMDCKCFEDSEVFLFVNSLKFVWKCLDVDWKNIFLFWDCS